MIPRRDIPLLIGVALWCSSLQIASAMFSARSLESPNASAQIARNLVQRGEYSVPAWTVLRGPAAVGDRAPLRAYQLPGEPLYLALGFRALPDAALRYLHVPVAALLVTAIAAVALIAGGRQMGLLTGLLASVDPFIVFHGPVWDDTFLSAALVWTVFALLLAYYRSSDDEPAQPSWIGPLLIAGCAGAAAMTRLQAQLVLAAVALAAIAAPPLRPLHRCGWAVLAGVIVGVCIWGARNEEALGRFYIGSSHDGVTLFRANYATARPSIVATGTAEWYDLDRLAPQYAAVAGLSEIEADRYFRRAAFDYMKSHPGEVARTAVLKLAVSLTGFDFSRPAASWRNTVFAGLNLGLLLLTAYAASHWRRWFEPTRAGAFLRWIAILATAVTLLLLAVGPVGFRYRIDLTGFTYLALSAVVTKRLS